MNRAFDIDPGVLASVRQDPEEFVRGMIRPAWPWTPGVWAQPFQSESCRGCWNGARGW
jgi:hypothetical protein